MALSWVNKESTMKNRYSYFKIYSKRAVFKNALKLGYTYKYNKTWKRFEFYFDGSCKLTIDPGFFGKFFCFSYNYHHVAYFEDINDPVYVHGFLLNGKSKKQTSFHLSRIFAKKLDEVEYKFLRIL